MDEDDIYPDSHEYAPPEPKMQDVEDEEEGEELESDSDVGIPLCCSARYTNVFRTISSSSLMLKTTQKQNQARTCSIPVSITMTAH